MKTYIYTVQHSSSARNYNRTIVVYRVFRNQPLIIGSSNKINTASYKGDAAVASQIISENTQHKMTKDGYSLQNKSTRILEV